MSRTSPVVCCLRPSQIGQQADRVKSEADRVALKGSEGHVSFTTLQTADIGPVQAEYVRECLLGQAAVFSAAAQVGTEKPLQIALFHAPSVVVCYLRVYRLISGIVLEAKGLKMATGETIPWYRRKVKKRWWALVAVFALVVIIASVAASNASPKSKTASTATTTSAPIAATHTRSGGATTTTLSSRVAAFQSWIHQIKSDLAAFEAGTDNVQIAFAELLSKSATQGDLVQASLAAKNAAPECSETSSNQILNLSSDTPPSGYPSLASFSTDISVWAEQEDQGVIIDVGKVANSKGESTGADSSLISDSQQADADARSLDAEVASAAKLAGVTHFSGLDLPIWGNTAK